MRVLLAPDKFRGSLTAAEVVAALRRGLNRALPGVQTTALPVADGGEGTVDAALAAGWQARGVMVTGPLGAPVMATSALSPDGGVAVVELAQASGIALVDPTPATARSATSVGVGELIAHACAAGARRLVVGLGGSACSDGGAGMLRALGVRFLDPDGAELPGGGAALAGLGHIDLAGLDATLAGVEVQVAADVDNPLLGPDGAATVFGPQKGADQATVADLEAGLTRLRDALARAGAPADQAARTPGAGAAGGVGFGAIAVLGAHRAPGVQTVLDLVGFAERVSGADLVITGEGSLDSQSLHGKTPVGVAAAAARAGVPVIAVAGRCTVPRARLAEHGIADVYTLTDLEPEVRTSMREAGRLLEDVAGRIASEHLEPR